MNAVKSPEATGRRSERSSVACPVCNTPGSARQVLSRDGIEIYVCKDPKKAEPRLAHLRVETPGCRFCVFAVLPDGRILGRRDLEPQFELPIEDRMVEARFAEARRALEVEATRAEGQKQIELLEASKVYCQNLSCGVRQEWTRTPRCKRCGSATGPRISEASLAGTFEGTCEAKRCEAHGVTVRQAKVDRFCGCCGAELVAKPKDKSAAQVAAKQEEA